MTQYVLPELPYDYDALEPHISKEIMTLHHTKHHQAYVDGANAAVQKLEEARANNDLSAVNLWEKNLAFNLGGHINHSIFWTNLCPEGGKIDGEIKEAIVEQFGSFGAFQAHFEANAMGIQGSGWSILGWDSLGKRMHIFQLFDQQSNMPAGIVPLLMLDMWEHAFYLDYLNVKANYVKAFWNIVNWENVNKRYLNAQKVNTVKLCCCDCKNK
ncbi:superoxide dismutase [Actinomyces sp. zg-332]|uniref:superoxide dismutase n=1 Tax=Actinomyces sp. zg-332 TaxID=2708340 RepID=UPI0014238075|nr:superoxide dismutase [Actinomyces sp. zg-332]QPK94635.1 superoxide dismutase [Actinomyces sp. zg-332]